MKNVWNSFNQEFNLLFKQPLSSDVFCVFLSNLLDLCPSLTQEQRALVSPVYAWGFRPMHVTLRENYSASRQKLLPLLMLCNVSSQSLALLEFDQEPRGTYEASNFEELEVNLYLSAQPQNLYSLISQLLFLVWPLECSLCTYISTVCTLLMGICLMGVLHSVSSFPVSSKL